MKKRKSDSLAAAKAAVLILAEIKSASDAFDRGEINAFDALNTILAAVAAQHAAGQRRAAAA